jgi:hypothetical protein
MDIGIDKLGDEVMEPREDDVETALAESGLFGEKWETVKKEFTALPESISMTMGDILLVMGGAKPDDAFKALTEDQKKLLKKQSRYLLLKELEPEDADRNKPDDDNEDVNLYVNVLKAAKLVDRKELMYDARALEIFSRDACTSLGQAAKKGDFKGLPTVKCPYADGDVVFWAETKLGPVIVGGTGRTIYYEDAALIIDLGGDDIYECRAGGSIGGVAVCIDVSGNDQYLSRKSHSFGAGFMGIGILIDGEGDDYYVSKNFSQGSGLLGVGILEDLKGNDVYIGDTCCQGAGAFGFGAIVDTEGNDCYRACLYSQGLGFTLGCGISADAAGNDTYYAGGKYPHVPLLPDQFQALSQGFGMGIRGANTSGGVGILWDGGGNDMYNADVYGQGASYWFSLGTLVDEGGNDSYYIHQYGQGGGIHLSVGILVDRAGRDMYSNFYGVGQGSAHDWAVGFLADKGGDDCYQGSGATVGVGLTNSVGIFIDSAGNDCYSGRQDASSGIQGAGVPARDSISVGIMLDLGGKDSYSGGTKNDTYWIKQNIGIGIDVETGTTQKK